MSDKKKDRELFWQKLFRHYDVATSLRGYHDFEHRFSISRFHIILYALIATALVAAITTTVLFYSPLKKFMPGYVNPQQRMQMLEASLRIDSLYETVQRHQLYVLNIQDIFRGDVNIDSVSGIDSLTMLRSADLMERTERESEFVRQYEANEKYNLTSSALRKSDMEGLHFSAPVRGMLTTPFEPADLHFGIDLIATNANQNVCAVLDGSVLMSGYTATNGYVVVIQHVGNIVSIYKHLTSIFHREGEKVKSGEAIGTLSPQGNKEVQPYLHFELWHKGTALDPTQYISF